MDSRDRKRFIEKYVRPDHDVETTAVRGPFFIRSLNYSSRSGQISAEFGPPNVYVKWRIVRNGLIVDSGGTTSGQVSYRPYTGIAGQYRLIISYNGQQVESTCNV